MKYINTLIKMQRGWETRSYAKTQIFGMLLGMEFYVPAHPNPNDASLTIGFLEFTNNYVLVCDEILWQYSTMFFHLRSP